MNKETFADFSGIDPEKLGQIQENLKKIISGLKCTVLFIKSKNRYFNLDTSC